jgi:hypothetical protein
MRFMLTVLATLLLGPLETAAKARPPSPSRVACSLEMDEKLPKAQYPDVVHEGGVTQADGSRSVLASYGMHPERQKFFGQCVCKRDRIRFCPY